VAVREFLFEIELSGPTPSRDMLSDLACQAFAQAGCSNADLQAIVDALHSAVASCTSAGEVLCGLRFRAHAGELEIDVTASGGGRVWHASRRTA
jgi:hypothetical protein